ncbi:MAG: ABC transporter permease [Ardenticatenia bacterium]|nr:ABC transporter permease [Ardenticatenia bacterium]
MDWTNVRVFASKELRDARRNRWFWLYTAIFASLSLALSWMGMAGVGGYRVAGFGRTAATLVNLVLLIVPLMGLTLGAMSVAGERDRGALFYVLAQPVTPSEVLAGKFLGLWLALAGSLAVGFGLSGLVVAWKAGVMQLGSYVALVGLAWGLGAVSLALGLLVSVVARCASTAVGVALFLWLMLVFLGDLGVMGTAVVLRLRVGQLLLLALLNPLQVFKVAAILAVRGSLEVLGPAGTYAVRTYGVRLMPLLFVVLAAWTVVPLSGAYLVTHRRGMV